jgi:hypothetical protein
MMAAASARLYCNMAAVLPADFIAPILLPQLSQLVDLWTSASRTLRVRVTARARAFPG